MKDREQIDLISRIADRGLMAIKNAGAMYPVKKLDMMMDIEFTHEVMPLDLQRFIGFDDGNFAHDIFGIYSHFNRETKVMDDQFVPRCALTQTDSDTQLSLLQDQWEGNSELISSKGSLDMDGSVRRVMKLEGKYSLFRYFQIAGKVLISVDLNQVDADTLIASIHSGRDSE